MKLRSRRVLNGHYFMYFILKLYIFLYVTLNVQATYGTEFTPVTLLHNATDMYEEDSVNKVVIEFIPHDVIMSVNENKNISCKILVNGSSAVNEIKLSFNYSDSTIVKTVPNITVFINHSDQLWVLPVIASAAGHTVMFAEGSPVNMTDTKNAFTRIAVHYSGLIDYFSNFIGWIYFCAWSVSFYPQTILNWRRKSVIGLHFDFLALNTIGFLVYSIFNIGLYWIPSVKKEYFNRHPHGVNPVQLNDVIFSIHAFCACLIQALQCVVYEKGDQKITKSARSIIGGLTIISVIVLILGSTSVIVWLDFLYVLSYIKLFITLIKYIPQAYFNYLRKSTSGWSIGNIILDFTGGTFSIFQMFIIAYNYNDWSSLFGDPTKFGLGLFSIIFDIFFMVQHYILYKGYEPYQLLPESPASTSHSHQISSESYHGLNYASESIQAYA